MSCLVVHKRPVTSLVVTWSVMRGTDLWGYLPAEPGPQLPFVTKSTDPVFWHYFSKTNFAESGIEAWL